MSVTLRDCCPLDNHRALWVERKAQTQWHARAEHVLDNEGIGFLTVIIAVTTFQG